MAFNEEFTNAFDPQPEFTTGLELNSSQSFVNDSTSKESATIKALGETGFSPELSARIQTIDLEQQTSGSINVDQITQKNIDGSKATFGAMDLSAEQALTGIQEDIETEKQKPQLLTLYEDLADELQAQGVSEKALPFMTVAQGIYKRRHLHDVLKATEVAIFEGEGAFELVGDFTETFFDFFGANERFTRRTIIDETAGTGFEVQDYNFLRSSDIKDLLEGFDSMPFEQQLELVNKAAKASQEVDSLTGNFNAFYNSEFLSELASATDHDYGSNDWISWLEAAGLAGLIRTPKILRDFFKASTHKLLRVQDSAKGVDVSKDLRGLEDAVDEYLSNFDPSAPERTALEVLKVSPSTEGYSAIRAADSRALNVANNLSPTTLKNIMQGAKGSDNVEGALKSLGVDGDAGVILSAPKMADEASEGINSRTIIQEDAIPSNTEMTNRTSAVQLFQERPLGLTLTENEIQSAAQRRFSRVELLAGDTISMHTNKIDVLTDPGSTTFIGRFGKNDEFGFDSYEDAVTAAQNLVGETFEVQIRRPNEDTFVTVQSNTDIPTEYFVSVPVRREFTPADGHEFLDGSTWYNPSYLNKFFLTNTDRIGKNIVADFSFLKDFNLAVSNRLQKSLKPYTGLSKGNRDAVNNLLEVGDRRQVEFTPVSAGEALGRTVTPDSKVWKAYTSVRDYYDEIADINDIRVRADMDTRGFKSTGVLDEFGNPVYGKPLTLGELRGSGAKTIFDTRSQRAVSVQDIENLDDAVAVQLNRTVSFEGNEYSTVIRSLEDIQPLPDRVVPRRTGYVNLAYNDVGALIKLSYPRIVNGVSRVDGGQEILRFAKTVKEAEEFLSTKPKGSALTNRELLLKDAPEGAELITSESRESLFEMSSVEVRPDGITLPYNLRGRKDNPIENVRGSVEILEMEERISKSLNSMERTLNRDGIDIMKKRFMTQYAPYLRDPKKFPDGKDLAAEFRVTQAGIVADEQTRKNMANIHNYILDTERTLGFRSDSLFQKGVDEALESITRGRVGKVDMIKNTKSLASFIAIWGRPAFQALANVSQAMHLVQRDPIRGSASIVETALAAPMIALRKQGKNVNWDAYAKLSGFESGEALTKWIDSIETSGVFSAAKVDNLLSNFDQSRKISSRGKVGRALAFTPKSAKVAQALGTDLSNLASYRHAVKVVQEKFPRLDPYSAEGIKATQEVFRDLTLRMDKSDVLVTETEPLSSLMFLWTQHVYKGFKDTIVQPTIKTFTGKDISKNPSLWADSWQQAFTSTAMNLSLFGAAGMIGTDLTLEIDELARENGILEKGETFNQFFYEGMVDMMFKNTIGVDVNTAERISFGDAISMMFSLSGLAEGNLNVIGGAEVASTRIGKLFDTFRVINNTPIATEEDALDLIKFAGNEALSVFSGWTDYQKSEMVKNLGTYFSNSGQALYSVDPSAEMATLFSFRPDDAVLRERILFDGKGSNKEQNFYTDVIPKTFARWYWQEISELAEKDQLTFDTYNEQLQRFYRLVDAVAGNTGAKNLAYDAKRAFNRLAIDPRGVFKEAALNSKNKALMEKIVDNYSFSEAQAKLEQIISIADDPNLKETAEVMLQSLELQRQILEGNNG